MGLISRVSSRTYRLWTEKKNRLFGDFLAERMASELTNYVNQIVEIVTWDGRLIVGTLKGFDQNINLILNESHERVFSTTTGVEKVPLGLYVIRGDTVAMVGEVNQEVDNLLDFNSIKAAPIK